MYKQRSEQSLGSKRGNIDVSDDDEMNEKRGSIKKSSSETMATANANGEGGSGENGQHSVKWDVSSFAVGKSSTMLESLRTDAHRKWVKDENIRYIMFSWNPEYKLWWGFTLFWSVLTIFFETYQIAFGTAGLPTPTSGASIIQYIFSTVFFFFDIIINFNLAFYDEMDQLVYDRPGIAKNYLKFWFWIDLMGVFPFYAVALAIAGEMGNDNTLTQYLSLLSLFRLVRLYRIKQLFEVLQWSMKISLISLTLTRNLMFALIWTHLAACVMFFIAKQYQFDPDNTWIGSSLEGLNDFEKYLTSLYWSVVTFTTVGYGDFSPVNLAEQIWGILFMLLNMILQAWFIGSITLLIVKSDEKTSEYRETVQVLNQYSALHGFDKPFRKRLKTQLKLEYNSREISDEHVLKDFPSSVRRRVLRRLYLPSLVNTSLMRGIRQQFVDAFLTTCNVEIFSPGEEVLQRGSISSDLYLLVEGVVKLVPMGNVDETAENNQNPTGTSIADSEGRAEVAANSTELDAGEFVNEIGFFTETPQIDTVRTVTICKTLTMTKSAFSEIAEHHPGSVSKILQNLLQKTEKQAEIRGTRPKLTTTLSLLNTGSEFEREHEQSGKHSQGDGDRHQHLEHHNTENQNHDVFTNDLSSSSNLDMHGTIACVHTQAALSSIQELITMHINKQKDDHTTRFLFAASRGDIPTIRRMCDQGFDPNSSDYDNRTGLMVAAMKGNVDVVKKILEYHGNPNLVDMHGTSALFEATKSGQEETVNILLAAGGELCLTEAEAASSLCQAVFEGDILLLRRLLSSKIQVNAQDYDKRTAIHIAAAEGNIAALKVLVEFGADTRLRDRWNNTIYDEARRMNAVLILEFLETLGDDRSTSADKDTELQGSEVLLLDKADDKTRVKKVDLLGKAAPEVHNE